MRLVTRIDEDRNAQARDPPQIEREVDLPRRVLGIGLGEGFADRERLMILLERRLPLALVRQGHADMGVADRELALHVELLRIDIKIAARVVEMKTMIRVHLPTSCPAQDILRFALGRIPRLVT